MHTSSYVTNTGTKRETLSCWVLTRFPQKLNRQESVTSQQSGLITRSTVTSHRATHGAKVGHLSGSKGHGCGPQPHHPPSSTHTQPPPPLLCVSHDGVQSSSRTSSVSPSHCEPITKGCSPDTVHVNNIISLCSFGSRHTDLSASPVGTEYHGRRGSTTTLRFSRTHVVWQHCVEHAHSVFLRKRISLGVEAG
jgi:hypothetical protein